MTKVADLGVEGSDARSRVRSALESLLLAAGDPVSVRRLGEVFSEEDRPLVPKVLRELAADYERDGRGFRLEQVAGGYQLRTAPENREAVRALLRPRPSRLSRASLETVAIVAYKQPVTRAEIEAVRGVDVASALATLVERHLVRIAGRKETLGRPLLYATTPEFLELFGLRELGDLPSLEELGESTDRFEEVLRRAEEAEQAQAADEPSAADVEPEAPERASFPEAGNESVAPPAEDVPEPS